MKTTDFLNESDYSQEEYSDEAGMVKDNLHTIIRAMTDLCREIKDNEDIPEWAQEKIAQAKGMLVSVMDYIISEKEMALDSETGEEGHMMAENKRFIVKRNSYEAKLLESLSRAIYKLR